jgi:hypothetical protein
MVDDREPGWLDRVFEQNERDIDAFPERLRQAADERVHGKEPYDLVSPWLRNKAIRAAEKRVATAAMKLRLANQEWLDVAYRVEVFGQPAYFDARRRWMEADKEFIDAVDALAVLKGEEDATT